MSRLAHSAAATRQIAAADSAVFDYLDDHRNLSMHMEQRSWAMMGSRMDIHMDAGGTRAVGSRFGFSGSFLGIPLAVDEVVTARDPPRSKAWETVGEPTLWVIGRCRMGFRIAADGASSLLTVFIDYDLPTRSGPRAAGWLLGGSYARWCTGRMVADAARHFQFQGTRAAAGR